MMSGGGKKEPADFKRLAKIMRDANYRGYIVLEYEEAGNVREECEQVCAIRCEPRLRDRILAGLVRFPRTQLQHFSRLVGNDAVEAGGDELARRGLGSSIV